jgi:hypothetical protein
MARPASELSNNPFLRVLLMSPAKVGKTFVSVTTSPAPVRVILCEDDSALRPVLRITDKFSVSEARKLGKGAFVEMQNVLLEAKNDAKDGKVKTVIVDPFSEFAHHLLEESFEVNKTGSGADNGMVAYGEYARRLDHIIDYMFTIPCHLIVISHYATESPEMTGQIKKQGEGIVPLIPGKMRNRMGGKFGDILWMDIDPKDNNKRVFVTGPRGAWGPGCRHAHGAQIIPADFGELIKLFAAENKKPLVKLAMRQVASVRR